MRVSSLLPGVAVLVQLAGGADAADDSVKEKVSLCTSCHGERGVSQTENTPSLAGQPDLFLQWQLVFFRSGSRKNEVMQPIAEQLSNEDIRNLCAYFRLAAASCGDKARRIFSSGVGRKNRGRTQLCVMPHRYICRNEDGPHRWTARRLSCQSAT
jgi:cytochrome c553